MKERIQKVLAEAGIESRRHVEEMVLSGRIAVNGEVVTKLPVMVEAGVDEIAVDDEIIRIDRRLSEDKVYLLMNKPRGVYCTNVAQGEQKRAIDLLPPGFQKRVYPVGRLDAESRGLLLLTNDGDLTQKLTHPKFGVPKTYTAVVDGFLQPETVVALSEGIWLSDPKKGGFKTGRSRIKVIRRSAKQSVLEITIREGRNRQVRRMLAKIGHKVRELTRIKMGPLALEGLKVGSVRALRPKELASLLAAVEPKDERDEKFSVTKASKPSAPPIAPVGKRVISKRPRLSDKPDRPGR